MYTVIGTYKVEQLRTNPKLARKVILANCGTLDKARENRNRFLSSDGSKFDTIGIYTTMFDRFLSCIEGE
jgi:hypothetical protein